MDNELLELEHHGVKGMHWGERRYQNEDGSYTELGKERRRVGYNKKPVEEAEKIGGKAYKDMTRKERKAAKKRARHNEAERREKRQFNRDKEEAINNGDLNFISKNAHRLTDSEIDYALSRYRRIKMVQDMDNAAQRERNDRMFNKAMNILTKTASASDKIKNIYVNVKDMETKHHTTEEARLRNVKTNKEMATAEADRKRRIMKEERDYADSRKDKLYDRMMRERKEEQERQDKLYDRQRKEQQEERERQDKLYDKRRKEEQEDRDYRDKKLKEERDRLKEDKKEEKEREEQLKKDEKEREKLEYDRKRQERLDRELRNRNRAQDEENVRKNKWNEDRLDRLDREKREKEERAERKAEEEELRKLRAQRQLEEEEKQREYNERRAKEEREAEELGIKQREEYRRDEYDRFKNTLAMLPDSYWPYYGSSKKKSKSSKDLNDYYKDNKKEIDTIAKNSGMSLDEYVDRYKTVVKYNTSNKSNPKTIHDVLPITKERDNRWKKDRRTQNSYKYDSWVKEMMRKYMTERNMSRAEAEKMAEEYVDAWVDFYGKQRK